MEEDLWKLSLVLFPFCLLFSETTLTVGVRPKLFPGPWKSYPSPSRKGLIILGTWITCNTRKAFLFCHKRLHVFGHKSNNHVLMKGIRSVNKNKYLWMYANECEYESIEHPSVIINSLVSLYTFVLMITTNKRIYIFTYTISGFSSVFWQRCTFFVALLAPAVCPKISFSIHYSTRW